MDGIFKKCYKVKEVNLKRFKKFVNKLEKKWVGVRYIVRVIGEREVKWFCLYRMRWLLFVLFLLMIM